MNMNQKRKSCRMVSNLRHILSICKEEGVGGNSHNPPSYPTLSLPPGHPPRVNLGHLLETLQLRLGSEPAVSLFCFWLLYVFISQAQLPQSMSDLTSPIMEQTRVPCTARKILNHWIHQGSPNPMVFLLWSHTQSQDSMKPSLLMSRHRRNSVSDKVVTKK